MCSLKTIIEPIWEKQKQEHLRRLSIKRDADLFVGQGSSASIATQNSLSGQSAALDFSLRCRRRKVALLLGGGLLIALGGLLASKLGSKRSNLYGINIP